MHIVLVEPEIPPNTGNIARTCAATASHLHLVGPLGFSIDDRYLKRAGLDYWHLVPVHVYNSFPEFLSANPGRRLLFFCAKAKMSYADIAYQPNDFLVFGSETKGLSPEILGSFPENWLRIPMKEGARSLNLSNAVAVVIYEALRQHSYPGLR
ncbi:MAG: tRNA (uridine(34)/cytosine(34)/5-carboxymethylaminomethyluridine(34)-2'-O)-methyltransferase TrmL [Syntrophomonadaceae bacterium]|nr:tRNA (uridine(34)/cytosine(34)/5-carboxymethylaminomethyluridine(34)-2'-O)-methyltransferase TrmL [Syntrophomonadaceae bacterium]